MNTDYSYLRTEYPATISMDQLYKICHVSKRKARWLLEHGVIPCEDNGNQTRRFAIQLTDVITFLKNLEQGKVKNLPPPGSFPSKPSAKHINYRKVTATAFTEKAVGRPAGYAAARTGGSAPKLHPSHRPQMD